MKFSIITIVRNNKEMLKEAISSVSSQKDIELEHIIVDGDSTDGTKEYLYSLNDKKIKIKSEKDEGIYDAFNKGLTLCNNDIIGILHSDDLFAYNQVLSDICETFKTGVDVVYADLEYVNREDVTSVVRKWSSGVFNHQDLQFGWMPPHPTFFFKRELLNDIGLFDLSYKIASDYDYMLRILTKSDIKVGYLPKVISKMRIGGASNQSLENIIRKSQEDYQIAKKHFSSPLGTVLLKNLRKIKQFQFSYFIK